jgi:hypothetical protein
MGEPHGARAVHGKTPRVWGHGRVASRQARRHVVSSQCLQGLSGLEESAAPAGKLPAATPAPPKPPALALAAAPGTPAVAIAVPCALGERGAWSRVRPGPGPVAPMATRPRGPLMCRPAAWPCDRSGGALLVGVAATLLVRRRQRGQPAAGGAAKQACSVDEEQAAAAGASDVSDGLPGGWPHGPTALPACTARPLSGRARGWMQTRPGAR